MFIQNLLLLAMPLKLHTLAPSLLQGAPTGFPAYTSSQPYFFATCSWADSLESGICKPHVNYIYMLYPNAVCDVFMYMCF